MRRVALSVVCAVLVALPAAAQEPTPTTELNIGPWVEAAKNQLMYQINQAGNLLFTILAAIVGLGLVMRMVSAVAKK